MPPPPQCYGRLFFLLQTTPEYVARLTRLVSSHEIDGLLQTVMFTLYGKQYEDREEHLLLSMFDVRPLHAHACTCACMCVHVHECIIIMHVYACAYCMY